MDDTKPLVFRDLSPASESRPGERPAVSGCAVEQHLTGVARRFVRLQSDVRSDGVMVRVFNMHPTAAASILDLHALIRDCFGVGQEFGVTRRSLDYNRQAGDLPRGELVRVGPVSISTFGVRLAEKSD